MTAAYQVARESIGVKLERLIQSIEKAQAAGEAVTPGWLYQEKRYTELLDQVDEAMADLAESGAPILAEAQRDYVALAAANAETLTHAALGDSPAGVSVAWNRLPAETLESFVGFASDGSPLHDLLAELSPETGRGMREILIEGLAQGINPREMARQATGILDITHYRALNIARTETMRAAREASRQTYLANQHAVTGWRWTSALDRRTCPACWALHGSFHTVDEVLDDHIRGRCVAAPATKSWAEMGYPGVPDNRPVIESGEEIFRRLPFDRQQEILGQAAWSAYIEGSATFSDFAKQLSDPRWGTMRVAKPLREIVGAEKAEAIARDIRVWKTMQASWVRGPSRKQSVLLKLAAREEFVLPQEVWKRGKHKFTMENIEAARSAVRRMYHQTQYVLNEHGIRGIHLYRGVKTPTFGRGALEAWSSDIESARKFAEYGIIEADVPADRILAFSQGPNWQNGSHGEEHEYLVLGDQ